MKSMVNSTGGFMILSDSFTTAIFKQSFQRVFNKDAQGNLQMAYNATLDVQVRVFGDASSVFNDFNPRDVSR